MYFKIRDIFTSSTTIFYIKIYSHYTGLQKCSPLFAKSNALYSIFKSKLFRSSLMWQRDRRGCYLENAMIYVLRGAHVKNIKDNIYFHKYIIYVCRYLLHINIWYIRYVKNLNTYVFICYLYILQHLNNGVPLGIFARYILTLHTWWYAGQGTKIRHN